jgi:hypothetical protein
LKGRAYSHTFSKSSHRAQGGYLSTSALLEAQQNITNIYGKVSQQMTSAKQSGLLFDVARFPINLCFRRLNLTFFKHNKGLFKSTSKIAEFVF